tara:strand:+ start:225 stop:437 length:213 start_codon:yes stop_codon:yes gene_type:complete
MGDVWDYKLRKMAIAWELASRLIPSKPQDSGGWTVDTFIGKSQEAMKEAQEAVDAVFKDDHGIKASDLVP